MLLALLGLYGLLVLGCSFANPQVATSATEQSQSRRIYSKKARMFQIGRGLKMQVIRDEPHTCMFPELLKEHI